MIELIETMDDGKKPSLNIIFNGEVVFHRKRFNCSAKTGANLYKFNGRFWNLKQLRRDFAKFEGTTLEEFETFARGLTKAGRTYHDRK